LTENAGRPEVVLNAGKSTKPKSSARERRMGS
jgi:hypothetical protein